MSSSPEKFAHAIARIDRANSDDPRTTDVDGKPVPNELLYSQRMTRWLDRLEPDASEALRLAVRAQHIMRWKIPRTTYPIDRTGYLTWRIALYAFHADQAGQILRDVGYDKQTIARVQSLLRKERLKTDPEAQTLEDVACLVFLEHYFFDFAREHDDEKLISILRKTWKKMSPRAREVALTLKFSDFERSLIERALAPSPGGKEQSQSTEPPTT